MVNDFDCKCSISIYLCMDMNKTFFVVERLWNNVQVCFTSCFLCVQIYSFLISALIQIIAKLIKYLNGKEKKEFSNACKTSMCYGACVYVIGTNSSLATVAVHACCNEPASFKYIGHVDFFIMLYKKWKTW